MRVFHFSMPIKSAHTPICIYAPIFVVHATNQEVNPPFHSYSTKFNAFYHFFQLLCSSHLCYIHSPYPLTYFCFTPFLLLTFPSSFFNSD
ncbi:hypothetical protein VNO80_09890 [Phaseolus coccineus]|uniref:Uncharacterized protein n=1 Tax=Phaseolus coccineus TaxID=3886 RepID=A0AAN9N8W3_PHACN